MTPILVTPPTVPVVQLLDMRDHLRVDHYDDDVRIMSIERAAVAHHDGWKGVLGRCIMPQTWRQDFTCWGKLRIAMPDASEFVVTYRDADGVWQPIEDFEADIDGAGPYVEIDEAPSELFRVQYQCALPVEQLPAIQMAVKLYAETLYDGKDLPPAYHAIISALRWWTV
ncbi:hypothetical protein [Acidiphilium sp.]|uniref:hypothetical protein n=1 Tax=Acidiphilium sp. TaxID=527 RepID=UPI002588E6D0|nr:hypothetical protein [Acidiphilium sp.]